MATCLKRTSKLFDLSLIRGSAEVNLRDLICPVCRGILIEPVTLPCTHNLCLRCLKGTFEHNSLSCPLCRVRVGSWLRTATKSETLVNGALWKLIRSRFPKEVESKRNGDDGDIELDSDFAPKKIILSAAGEIRREYEVQLRAAEEEMRKQCETERLANEALIRKIHEEEERETLSQLASDRLLAKSLAKKQLSGKEKRSARRRVDNRANDRAYGAGATSEHENPDENSSDVRRGDSRAGANIEKNSSGENEVEKSNATMKVRDEKNSARKIGSLDSSIREKFDSSVRDVVTRTLKHRDIGKSTNISNLTGEPSCSGAQIYGSRSKEELHVPTDILCSKKKTLGVEVCLTKSVNDERIGSAESAASHDSINQEIHHFKPIRPIARTSLKMSHDGRPIDPKLIRVIPMVKRVTDAVPKPPSPTHLKRILGCSWSAFRGIARDSLEQGKTRMEKNEKNNFGRERSTSKSSKPQPFETARRLDLAPEVSFDANKNYAKSINRIFNGTRVSKKLIMEEDPPRANRARKVQIIGRNIDGTRRKKKNKKYSSWEDGDRSDGEDEEDSSEICSPENLETEKKKSTKNDDTIENIAERIKRRRIEEMADKSCVIDGDTVKRRTRRNSHVPKSSENSKKMTKRRKICDAERATSGNADLSMNRSSDEIATNGSAKKNSETGNNGEIRHSSLNDFPSDNDFRVNPDNKSDIDRRIFEEQARMERLIMQEKKDFDLAMRLQAQFDDMERISGRTRGSRRAMENFDRFAELKIGETTMKVERGSTSRDCRNGKQRRRPQKNPVK